jgi:hypothetical protein
VRTPEVSRRPATAAGIVLIVMAVLDVSSGELAIDKESVRVVVGVGALAALILGTSLCVLSRFARRRLPGALLGMWCLCALSLPYLLLGLLVMVPGFAVQVTFPGGNVVSTSNLEAIVDGVRPGWFPVVDAALSVASVVLLVWALASAARAWLATSATAEEVATAGDPWTPTRVSPAR